MSGRYRQLWSLSIFLFHFAFYNWSQLLRGSFQVNKYIFILTDLPRTDLLNMVQSSWDKISVILIPMKLNVLKIQGDTSNFSCRHSRFLWLNNLSVISKTLATCFVKLYFLNQTLHKWIAIDIPRFWKKNW